MRRGVVLGVAALVATGLVVPWALAQDGDAPTSSQHSSRPAASTSPGPSPSSAGPSDAPPVTPARRAGAVESEPPTSVRLPSGAVVPVAAVSSRADGELDVPSDIRQAGWWSGGARIGDPFGSSLVAAHIDSTTQGLGPFAELLSVRPGQVVEVRTQHLRQRFRITSLRLVAQGTLPQHQWIYAPDGRRRLTLVTCAPPFVRDDGGYQNMAVVTARPINIPQPRRAHP